MKKRHCVKMIKKKFSKIKRTLEKGAKRNIKKRSIART